MTSSRLSGAVWSALQPAQMHQSRLRRSSQQSLPSGQPPEPALPSSRYHPILTAQQQSEESSPYHELCCAPSYALSAPAPLIHLRVPSHFRYINLQLNPPRDDDIVAGSGTFAPTARSASPNMHTPKNLPVSDLGALPCHYRSPCEQYVASPTRIPTTAPLACSSSRSARATPSGRRRRWCP